MIRIPFTKAHGARNDFLLTWADRAPDHDLDAFARAICDRHSGIGADGWMLMKRGETGGPHVSIALYNSDGSLSEISGNGTRCVAALMVQMGIAENEVRVGTGAGLKYLRVLASEDPCYTFEMDMGTPEYTDEVSRNLQLENGTLDVTILNVGNPQCAAFVQDFEFDWRAAGSLIERHRMFPNRTNVSFVRAVDRHSIDVRFWERGAGETMSSGTGSTGAAFAALKRGLVDSPVQVMTPAGVLDFQVKDGRGFLTGPAQLVGTGEFFARL